MINDLKKGMSLLKYTYSFKKNLIGALVFFVLGCIFFAINCAPVAGMFIVESWMFISTLVSEFECSPVILTSPNRKRLLLYMQDAIVMFGSIFTLVFVLVVSNVRGFTETHQLQVLCVYLMLGWMIIYISLLNKSYALAMCAMAVLIVLILVGFTISDPENYMDCIKMFGEIPVYAVNIVGVASFVIGNIAGFVIRRVLYKKPMSASISKRYAAMMK